MLAESPNYRFSDFLLDVGERCLKKDNRQIYLPPKTFATLLYLIERRGRLVTKEELLDKLWPDAEVTENALTRCIKEVRLALGDDVHDPRYIKTVPRVGYRFIADAEPLHATEPVTIVEEELTAMKVEVTDEVTPEDSLSRDAIPIPAGSSALSVTARLMTRFRRRPWIVVAALSVLCLAVACVIWYGIKHPKPALGFAERDWVLIADFENLTGEKVFDAALRTALERELSRSSYVNYVPPPRVSDTLALMKRDLDTRIDETVGREVCLRDGNIRALLVGSVQQIGASYAISLKVVDPRTGVAITSLGEDASNIQEVLPAIRRLAVTLRETLGESLASISRSDQYLQRVTTPSLEALEAYSKGMHLNEQYYWPQALLYFDRAVELDPNFAIAHWARARAHYWNRQPFEADLNRAAGLVDRVTEREKCTILAAQALHSHSDLKRTVEILERLLRLYPDDFHANDALRFLYLAMGDLSGSQECSKNCRRIRPNLATNHFDDAFIALLQNGDVEKYYSESMQALTLDSHYPAGLPNIADAVRDWVRGDVSKAETRISDFRAAKMAALGPLFQISVRAYLARFYLFIGKPDVALELLETTRGMAAREAGIDLTRYWRLERALIYREQGNIKEFERLARSEASEAIGLSRIEALGWLGIASAQSGRAQEALAYRNELLKENRSPLADLLSPPLPREQERGKRAFDIQIEGETALAEGKLDQAISCFKEVIQRVPPQGTCFSTSLQPQLFFVASQSLARAYERREEWKEAATAYEDILAHKVLTVSIPGASEMYVQALGSVSRALEKSGETTKAAAYREQFRRLRPHGI
ncbi:MAG TPA: winged helix-turn-helix domain-containing protein [Acidobacteriota bacterium]|nr:winged helix-turn-helix domain-containing protein [Acidobacteriota bacterium]